MRFIIAMIIIVLSVILFKKSSGTLKINLINVSSFVFYSLMVFEFIGVTLVFLGFRDHYLIQKISSEEVINKTYLMMSYTMIVLPIIIILSNKFIYKIKNMKETYIENVNKEVVLEDKEGRKKIFILITILSVICLIATIYVFYIIGYIPLFKYFDSNFNFAQERISSGRNFAGNQYIKNIVMLTITPIISYIAYIYMRTTKERKWTILFVLLFIINIFIKTYDFAKAPLVYYICYFFIIEVLLGKTFKIKKILPFCIVAVTLVVLSYTITAGYKGSYFSLSEGPLSRLMITQAGTLFLHVDAFPNKIDYLKGHSFPPITRFLFGAGEYDIRSGREVMKIYSKAAVENGTAGVMSTMFMGEAYANFGITGTIISSIVVGIVFSSILCIYLKSKKTPLNMALYLEGFIVFTTVLQGGFIDFFYNIQFLVALIVIFSIKILVSEKTTLFLQDIKEKLNIPEK